jgi:ketosteroid isomerase-like protein
MNNREVIEQVYAAAKEGNEPVYRSLMAADCVLYEPPNHPAIRGTLEPQAPAAVWTGLDQVLRGIGQVFAALRLTGVTVHEIVADANSERVIGLVDVHGTDHQGKPYTMPLAEVFLVRDGKVREVRAYYWDITRLCEHSGVK